MDALDLFELLGFGRLYDRIEDRFGRAGALLVTFTGGPTIIGVLIMVILIAARL